MRRLTRGGIALASLTAVFASLIALPRSADADPIHLDAFLNITENSSTSLTVSSNLPFHELSDPNLLCVGCLNGTFDFNGVVSNLTHGPEAVSSGALGGIFSFDPTLIIHAVNWREAENSNTFNTVLFEGSGNSGQTVIYYTSDNAVPDFGISPCNNGPCPIVPAGTSYQMAYSILTGPFASILYQGTLDVTFTDLGDSPSATPLPSTWFLLLSGFVGLGFFAYRGAKKGSAAIAAA